MDSIVYTTFVYFQLYSFNSIQGWLGYNWIQKSILRLINLPEAWLLRNCTHFSVFYYIFRSKIRIIFYWIQQYRLHLFVFNYFNSFLLKDGLNAIGYKIKEAHQLSGSMVLQNIKVTLNKFIQSQGKALCYHYTLHKHTLQYHNAHTHTCTHTHTHIHTCIHAY